MDDNLNKNWANLTDLLEAEKREKDRICRAIGQYAFQQPLDLKSPKELQADLMAIVGQSHSHQASIGSDQCALCLHDLRHDVHTRWDKAVALGEKREASHDD